MKPRKPITRDDSREFPSIDGGFALAGEVLPPPEPARNLRAEHPDQIQMFPSHAIPQD